MKSTTLWRPTAAWDIQQLYLHQMHREQKNTCSVYSHCAVIDFDDRRRDDRGWYKDSKVNLSTSALLRNFEWLKLDFIVTLSLIYTAVSQPKPESHEKDDLSPFIHVFISKFVFSFVVGIKWGQHRDSLSSCLKFEGAVSCTQLIQSM